MHSSFLQNLLSIETIKTEILTTTCHQFKSTYFHFWNTEESYSSYLYITELGVHLAIHNIFNLMTCSISFLLDGSSRFRALNFCKRLTESVRGNQKHPEPSRTDSFKRQLISECSERTHTILWDQPASQKWVGGGLSGRLHERGDVFAEIEIRNQSDLEQCFSRCPLSLLVNSFSWVNTEMESKYLETVITAKQSNFMSVESNN